jgi:hypothetical protein
MKFLALKFYADRQKVIEAAYKIFPRLLSSELRLDVVHMKAQSRFNHRGRFETCPYTIYWISARASFSVRDPSLGEIASWPQ